MKKKKISKKWKIVFIVLGVTVLLCVSESFISKTISEGEYGLKYNLTKRFRLHKAVSSYKNEVLIIGDSSCNAGVSVRLFSQLVGQRSQKVAIPARLAMMNGYYFLEEILKKENRLRSVIIVTTPLLEGSNEFQPDYFADTFFSVGEVIRLYKGGVVDIGDIFTRILPNLLPSFRYRFGIRSFLDHQLSGLLSGRKKKKPANLKEETRAQAKARRAERKKRLEAKRVLGINKYLKFCWRVARKNNYYISEYNKFYFTSIIRLAAQHNIKVYYYTGPVYNKFFTKQYGIRFFEDAFKFMKEWERAYPNFKQINSLIVKKYGFQHLSNNTIHLNEVGAEIFTKKLAEAFLKASGD